MMIIATMTICECVREKADMTKCDNWWRNTGISCISNATYYEFELF